MTVTHAERGIPADTFENRLVLTRTYAGHLSIADAALRCGLGRSAWQNWERGVNRPANMRAVASLIADTLGVDADWLIKGGRLAPPPGPNGGATIAESWPLWGLLTDSRDTRSRAA